MKLVLARFAMVDPEPTLFALLVAEPSSGPAWYEVIAAPGKEFWRGVVQGRVRELAPDAHSIEEIVSAASYNNLLSWSEVREVEGVVEAIREAFALVGREPGSAVVG
jgi:hypothetical protein